MDANSAQWAKLDRILEDHAQWCIIKPLLVQNGAKKKKKIDFGWCKIMHYEWQMLHQKSLLKK
jgi:hypothetical protein